MSGPAHTIELYLELRALIPRVQDNVIHSIRVAGESGVLTTTDLRALLNERKRLWARIEELEAQHGGRIG